MLGLATLPLVETARQIRAESPLADVADQATETFAPVLRSAELLRSMVAAAKARQRRRQRLAAAGQRAAWRTRLATQPPRPSPRDLQPVSRAGGGGPPPLRLCDIIPASRVAP